MPRTEPIPYMHCAGVSRWAGFVTAKFNRIFAVALIAVTSLAGTAPSHSTDKQVEVVGAILANVFEPESDGPYNVIFNQVTAGMTAHPRLTMMPTKRAQRTFYTKQTDCLFVATSIPSIYEDRGLKMENLVLSTPVYRHPMRVYSGRGSAAVNASAQMAGNRIAVDSAAISSEGAKTLTIPDDAVIIPASTTEQAFSLLESGRVEHVVAFEFDVAALGQRLPLIQDYPFDPMFDLIRNSEVFACHRTPETEAFITHVNEVLATMRADETLAEIFSTQTTIAR